MPLIFTLSMPNNNSWNGKWSGEGNLYAVTRRNPRKKELLDKILGYHSHVFGDGWVAAVEVKVASAAEANKVVRKSKGFCGYDWMVSSIMQHGEIRV